MSREIHKKTTSDYFQLILDGQKTYEYRLADWACKPGDILVLDEIDAVTKRLTGRQVRRKVGFVGKTKGYGPWPKADIDKYGFQIISLLGEDVV